MPLASEGGTNKVVDGSVSIVFLKDPTDPKWTNDAAMKLYRTIMKRYAPGANANDVYHVYGMAVGMDGGRGDRKVGKNLTRDGLVKAVGSMNMPKNPFLLPGIAVKTGAGDHFPIEQMLLQRWHKGALAELRRALGLPHRLAPDASRPSSRGGSVGAGDERPREVAEERDRLRRARTSVPSRSTRTWWRGSTCSPASAIWSSPSRAQSSHSRGAPVAARSLTPTVYAPSGPRTGATPRRRPPGERAPR